TALEALLIEESESAGKKTKLASRVSKLVAESGAPVQGVANDVEELYRTRSECVHAGLVDVEKAEVTRGVRLVASAVEAILTKPSFLAARSLKDILPHIDPSPVRSDEDRSRWVSESAYFRWLNEGQPPHHHFQHWLDAEREYICATLLRGRRLDSFGVDRQ